VPLLLQAVCSFGFFWKTKSEGLGFCLELTWLSIASLQVRLTVSSSLPDTRTPSIPIDCVGLSKAVEVSCTDIFSLFSSFLVDLDIAAPQNFRDTDDDWSNGSLM
jgi:hypothetical protein